MPGEAGAVRPRVDKITTHATPRNARRRSRLKVCREYAVPRFPASPVQPLRSGEGWWNLLEDFSVLLKSGGRRPGV